MGMRAVKIMAPRINPGILTKRLFILQS